MATLDDWKWLTGAEGLACWERLAGKTWETVALLAWLREKEGLSRERASLVAHQYVLRQRGREKFPTAEEMFFTPVGLEQATDAWVAAYKASRFPEGVPAADVCCGVGGDLLALARRGEVCGIERDAATAWVAQANLKDRGTVLPIDAEAFLERFSADAFPCLHIDPDRRPEGFRSTRWAFFAPSRKIVEQLLENRRCAAVKLAPGSELPNEWEKRGVEWEWIGRKRQCRQLVAWLGTDFAGKGGRYRATLVDSESGAVLRTFCGTPGVPIPAATTWGTYLFDVDSTFLAAGLEGSLAQTHHLHAVFPGSVYLTGNTPLDDPALSCFEILEVLPLDKKQVRKRVAHHGWGTLEIKKRGKTPLPEEVRKWFSLPPSPSSGTLFLVPSPKQIWAVLTRKNDHD
ncbi:MAG: class I SAM-dependent methyltransferase [Planctomycetia bacterium]|nr:class I SAM-dependent methyltransferase [Planctomycetia bacterium]